MSLKLLDMYCCAGGAAKGYHDAGYDVTGVDILFQKNYPYKFIQGDAIEYLLAYGHEFDLIHASPPCQFYSVLTSPSRKNNHPDLISPTRNALLKVGKPYIMENVSGARRELKNPIMLCGSMFGLPIQRHRYFELSWSSLILTPTCKHDFEPVLISGTSRKIRNGRRAFESTNSEKSSAIGIDWMLTKELDEAIPPVYTKFLGEQYLNSLKW